MTPLLTVALLFWSMLVFAAVAALLNRRSCRTLKSSWKPICLILLATALWRVPWNGVFFHGLEYEDSYIYTVAGRQMAEHVLPPSNDLESPFSFSVCAMGSIRDCAEWEPFPEHLIGYPYVIGLVVRAFGYTSAVGSLLNLVASLLSAVLVYLLTLTIAGDALAALLSGLLFAVVPVFAVYGLETSAEPFSSCCILLTLWLFVNLWETEPKRFASLGFTWSAYTCALLFAMTVKREDALLALALPVVLMFLALLRHEKIRGRPLLTGMIMVSSALALLLSLKMHLLATSQNEQDLLRQFPLTGPRLFGFIRSFLASFDVLPWYGGTFLAVCAGIVFAFRKKGLALIPVSLLISFIVVYASHIRGYYEMESGRVSPESALRFSMNLMGLWAITGGLGLAWLIRGLQRHSRLRPRQELLTYTLQWLGSGLLLASLITTFYLRRDTVEDETNSRVLPALVAVETASADSSHPVFILTMDPLVVQMFAGIDTHIVDLESLDLPMLNNLIASRAELLLLKQNDRFMDADVKRYGEPIRQLLALPSRRLDAGDAFSVSMIEPGGNRPQR